MRLLRAVLSCVLAAAFVSARETTPRKLQNIFDDNSIQETCTLNAQGYHGGVASGSRPYDVEFEYQVIVPQLVSNSAISSVLDTLIPESILPHFFECGGRRLRASSRKLQIRTGPFFIVARGDPEVAITAQCAKQTNEKCLTVQGQMRVLADSSVSNAEAATKLVKDALFDVFQSGSLISSSILDIYLIEGDGGTIVISTPAPNTPTTPVTPAPTAPSIPINSPTAAPSAMPTLSKTFAPTPAPAPESPAPTGLNPSKASDDDSILNEWWIWIVIGGGALLCGVGGFAVFNSMGGAGGGFGGSGAKRTAYNTDDEDGGYEPPGGSGSGEDDYEPPSTDMGMFNARNEEDDSNMDGLNEYGEEVDGSEEELTYESGEDEEFVEEDEEVEYIEEEEVSEGEYSEYDEEEYDEDNGGGWDQGRGYQ